MTRRATERFPTAVLITIVGALVALLAGLPGAAVLAAPWAVLLALGLPSRSPDQARATIDVSDDRVLVGDDIVVTVSVEDVTGSVGATFEPSAGFWTRGGPEHSRVTRVIDTVVGARAEVSRAMPASVWGTHDLGRVRLDVTHQYGLFRDSMAVAQPRIVRVHPGPTELRDLLTPWLVRRVTGTHRSGDVGRGIEYADIRPFTSGDSLRDINWRASARSRDLWVSQRHPDRATDVILLVDSFVESGHDVRTVFGLVIEAAVSLADSHLAVSDRVGLVELGGIVRWVHPGTGRLQLQQLTDTLLATGLYSSAADRDLRVIPPRALPPRSFVVALSPLLDDRFVDALFVLAGGGHDIAVVECAATPTDPRTEPESVARRIWEAERHITRDQLTDRGIAVAGWRKGEALGPALDELAASRHRMLRVARR